jgi:hypothetical protein
MLLVSRDGGPERYVIEIVEVDAEGGYRVVVQILRRTLNNEFEIERTPDNWPLGGHWFGLGLLLQRFVPLGFYNAISPFPRYRQEPRMEYGLQPHLMLPPAETMFVADQAALDALVNEIDRTNARFFQRPIVGFQSQSMPPTMSPEAREFLAAMVEGPPVLPDDPSDRIVGQPRAKDKPETPRLTVYDRILEDDDD